MTNQANTATLNVTLTVNPDLSVDAESRWSFSEDRITCSHCGAHNSHGAECGCQKAREQVGVDVIW